MEEYSTLSNEELFQRVKYEDDSTAYAVLYDRLWDVLYAFAKRTLDDKELIVDLLQDVFVQVWEKREEIHIRSSFQSYMYSMTYNEAINLLKRNKRFNDYVVSNRSIEPAENCIEHQLDLQDLQRSLRHGLAQMPDRMREAFIWSRTEHKSHREIGAIMGISVYTVKEYMKEALKRLRKAGITMFTFFL